MSTLLPEPAASVESNAHGRETSPSYAILYVEDDDALRDLTWNLLLKAGYRVGVANDGQVGWDALRLGSYDLLITDNQMPRLTGLELVKRLRSAGQTLPVVLVTGRTEVDDAHRIERSHLAATLMKPFTVAQLLDTVREVLRGAGSVRNGGELVRLANVNGT